MVLSHLLWAYFACQVCELLLPDRCASDMLEVLELVVYYLMVLLLLDDGIKILCNAAHMRNEVVSRCALIV